MKHQVVLRESKSNPPLVKGFISQQSRYSSVKVISLLIQQLDHGGVSIYLMVKILKIKTS